MRKPSMKVVMGGLAVLGVVVLLAERPPRSPAATPTPQAEAPRPVIAPRSPSIVAIAVPAPVPAVETAAWDIPDPDALPDDAYGRTVRRGRDLIARTSSLIGPDAPDPAKRHAGNGLDCQSCHIQAGTQQFGIPLAGIWGVFPQYIGRENEVRTLEERVNGCMERSMNGRPLPVDGPEMKSILTYIRHISAPERVGQSLIGRGTPALPLPDRAADPVRGQAIYAETCAAYPPFVGPFTPEQHRFGPWQPIQDWLRANPPRLARRTDGWHGHEGAGHNLRPGMRRDLALLAIT